MPVDFVDALSEHAEVPASETKSEGKDEAGTQPGLKTLQSSRNCTVSFRESLLANLTLQKQSIPPQDVSPTRTCNKRRQDFWREGLSQRWQAVFQSCYKEIAASHGSQIPGFREAVQTGNLDGMQDLVDEHLLFSIIGPGEKKAHFRRRKGLVGPAFQEGTPDPVGKDEVTYCSHGLQKFLGIDDPLPLLGMPPIYLKLDPKTVHERMNESEWRRLVHLQDEALHGPEDAEHGSWVHVPTMSHPQPSSPSGSNGKHVMMAGRKVSSQPGGGHSVQRFSRDATVALLAIPVPQQEKAAMWVLVHAMPVTISMSHASDQDSASESEPDGSHNTARPGGEGYFILQVIVPLGVPVSPLLLYAQQEGEANAPELIVDNTDIVSSLRHLRQHIWTEGEWSDGSDQDVGTILAEVAKECCETFTELTKDAAEHGHFVPRLGHAAACRFRENNALSELLKNLPRDVAHLKEALEDAFAEQGDTSPTGQGLEPASPRRMSKRKTQMTRLTSRRPSKHGGRSASGSPKAGTSEISFTIASAKREDDFALVALSPGFEKMTGYSAEFALGRNGRFLQPRLLETKELFNGSEIVRLVDFYEKQKKGPAFFFLLDERRNGEPQWHLVYMCGLLGDADNMYVLSIYTQLPLLTEHLNTLIIPNGQVSQDGLEHVARLRQLIQDKESSPGAALTSTEFGGPFSPFANAIIAQWYLEAASVIPSSYIGSHYCPDVGPLPVKHFQGKWSDFAASVLRGIVEFNKVAEETWRGDESLEAAMRDDPSSPVVAVSDPESPDCPLVHVSASWTELTGYSSQEALGRNGRFLQLTDKDLNRRMNRDEITKLTNFTRQLRNGKGADAMIFLLVNETKGGERFFNLIHIQHVEFHGKHYTIGITTKIDLPMPVLIMHKDKPEVDKEKCDAFAADLGKFLEHIRALLRSREDKTVSGALKFVRGRLHAYLKMMCDDCEGDHFVPLLGQREVELFKQSITWERLIATVGAERMASVWGSSTADGRGVSFCVADPQGPDCPTVHLTPEFEGLTAYSTQWCLGRNWRFMQPKEIRRNELLNSEEPARLREFCAGWAAAAAADAQYADHAPSSPRGGKSGPGFVSLLVAETRDGRPWWCLFAADHLLVDGRPYVLAAQVKLDTRSSQLVEALAMDPDGLWELTRLRGILQRQSRRIGAGETLSSVANLCVEQWAVGFSKVLDQGRFPVPGVPAELPLVGLEITSATVDSLPAALASGVRHVHIAFPSGTVADPRISELEIRLLALKISEMFNSLKRRRYDYYMSAGLVFTMRTPPHLLDAFAEVQKAMKSHKHSLLAWLLDASGTTNMPLIHDSWMRMSDVKRDGLVSCIGLYGGGEAAVDCILRSKGARPTLVSLEVVPGQEPDASLERSYQLTIEAGALPLAHGIFSSGARGSLLNSAVVWRTASDCKVSPLVPLIKWAEVQGFASIVPSLHQHAQDGESFEAAPPLSESQETEDAFRRLYSESTDALPAPAYPYVHRRLIRELQSVDATDVHQMEARLAGIYDTQDPFIIATARGFIVNSGAEPVPLRLALVQRSQRGGNGLDASSSGDGCLGNLKRDMLPQLSPSRGGPSSARLLRSAPGASLPSTAGGSSATTTGEQPRLGRRMSGTPLRLPPMAPSAGLGTETPEDGVRGRELSSSSFARGAFVGFAATSRQPQPTGDRLRGSRGNPGLISWGCPPDDKAASAKNAEAADHVVPGYAQPTGRSRGGQMSAALQKSGTQKAPLGGRSTTTTAVVALPTKSVSKLWKKKALRPLERALLRNARHRFHKDVCANMEGSREVQPAIAAEAVGGSDSTRAS
eukprot:TRINITY_DN8821_c0_g1_i2.p1 TRINITY_DN8821_c0_g1~~TRINITY_DN8821_c0_g1_i2.p1  ORF type:complete len:1814 (+),score=408.53 TRINITY_DN8821_c0_g1_i2:108-5549(+)